MLDELPEIFGVAKRTAWTYTRRKDFPKPYDVLSAGAVWRRAAVEKWADDHLPLPVGRPMKKRPRGKG